MSKRGIRSAEPESPAINWHQSENGVTIRDEENPDAWVHMEFEAGVSPEHRLFMICDDCGAVFAQRSKPGQGTVCGECGARYEHE